MKFSLNNKISGKVPVWVLTVILAVVILIVVLILLGTETSSPTEQPKENANLEQQQQEQQEQQESKVEKIFSRVGEITEIKEGEIKFLAPANKNILDEDKTMTALVSEETQYLRTTIPKTIPEGTKDVGSLFTKEEISFSDLKVGDNIRVISSVDISNKTEFPVVMIEVIEVK